MRALTEDGAKKVLDLLAAQGKQLPKKFGAMYEGEDGGAKVYRFFADEDSMNTYRESPEDHSDLLLGEITVQGAEDRKILRILTDVNASQPVTILEGEWKVNLRYVSMVGDTPTGDVVTITVERKMASDTRYQTVKTLPSRPSVGADSTEFTPEDITDLTDCLMEGAQSIRIVAKDEHGTSGILVFPSVTMSTLSLRNATDWSREQTGDIVLKYYITGAVQKTLHIKIDGENAYEGTAGSSTETALSFSVSQAKFKTTGVHNVEAWLVVGDKETEKVKGEFFYQQGETFTGNYVVVNNVIETIQPYTDAKLFDYAVFSPDGSAVNVVAKILSATDDTILEISLGNATPGTVYDYFGSIDIDSEEKTISAYLRFFSNGVDMRNAYWFITLDNSENFSPTAMQSGGFILNPKTRNNNQANARSIINALNGQTVNTIGWESFNMITDGWVDGLLRIPAGRKLTFNYNPFSTLATPNSRNSVTVELDVMIKNLQDYTAEGETILTIGDAERGFFMFPLNAHLLTASKRSQKTQDIQWQEDTRTHIAINIINNVSNSGKNFVRIFINGKVNREFKYDNDDVFSGSNGNLIIGSSKADIDIYGMRVYNQALSAKDVQQDYLASLPTVAEKRAFAKKNDILGDDDCISFTKSQAAGYNTLRFIAEEDKNLKPNYNNLGNNVAKGTVEMLVRNADGTLNKKYCQRITTCKQKGQGTSSMTYYAWNITYQATSASKRYIMDKNEQWIEDTSVSGEDCYFLFPNGHSGRADIKGLKCVAKLNWASSMQSHKIGWCNLYTDMYWACRGNSPINEKNGYVNARKSVTQLPFLHFVESKDGVCTYSSVMTFGPGKYDKACFGTKAPSEHYLTGTGNKPTSWFTALEGSANDRRIPMRMAPWLREEVFYYLNRSNSNDEKNETLVYAGGSQLDVDKAVMNVYEEDTDNEYEIPKGFTPVAGSDILWRETVDTDFDTADPYKCVGGNTIKFYRRAYNFDYLHCPHLEPISLRDLNSGENLDLNKQYWITDGNSTVRKYDLFRYNELSKNDASLPKWVNAGAAKDASTSDGYARLNLMEQCGSWITGGYNESDVRGMNDKFIEARISDYKQHSGEYYNNEDCDYDLIFRKFGALKDNWCKNTYESLQPNGRISMDSDDNDTSGDLDNVGASKCPYYAEEHDRCDADGTFNENGAATYWNSQDNVRFTLMEMARGPELKNMMQSFMDRMSEEYGSVMDCMHKYMFDIQEYFGATVYNENARILYEAAAMDSDYKNNTDPLSQSLGDHLQSEKEFWKKRIVYLASWCHANSFVNDTGTGSFSFRTIGTNNTFTYNITAHQAIYPALKGEGDGIVSSDKRVMPNGNCTLSVFVSANNINCFLYGIDYYTKIGDLTGMAIGSETLDINGKRLVEVKADGTDGKFSPQKLTITADRLKKLEITNVPTVGSISLSNIGNLEVLDLTGCDEIRSVGELKDGVLKNARLPKNLSMLTIKNEPQLRELFIEGYSKLIQFTIQNVPYLDLVGIITELYDFNATTAITCERVDWTMKSELLVWFARNKSHITGKIIIDGNLNGSDKLVIMSQFGDIDDAENPLYVIYNKVDAEDIIASVTGEDFISVKGTYQYGLEIFPEDFNAVKGVEWSISRAAIDNGYATIDASTGLLTVMSTPADEAFSTTVSAKITLNNGRSVTKTKSVAIGKRIEKITVNVSYAEGVTAKASYINVAYGSASPEQVELIDNNFAVIKVQHGITVTISFPEIDDGQEPRKQSFTTSQAERTISVTYVKPVEGFAWMMKDGTELAINALEDRKKNNVVGLIFCSEALMLNDAAFILPVNNLTGNVVDKMTWGGSGYDYQCLPNPSNVSLGDALTRNINGYQVQKAMISEDNLEHCSVQAYCYNNITNIGGIKVRGFLPSMYQLHQINLNLMKTSYMRTKVLELFGKILDGSRNVVYHTNYEISDIFIGQYSNENNIVTYSNGTANTHKYFSNWIVLPLLPYPLPTE